jgi:AraC-like DNA-binding protein
MHTQASIVFGMDPLGGLLDGPHARGAFLLRVSMGPPWSIRIEDEAPLALMVVVRGEAWVTHHDPGGDGQPILLRPGDVCITRGPDHYTVADDPTTPPQAIIHPGQRCTTIGGVELTQAMDLGVRTWGNAVEGPTVMLVGTYDEVASIGTRLLAAIPPLIVLRDDTWDTPLVDLLASEIAREDLAQEVVLDRLLDLLVVSALRAWLSRPEAEAPAWYRAHADAVVGRALRMLQHNPAHAWTVAELASEVGVSRAALARRFTDLVGEPPMAFLTGWRMALAADLLRRPDATVAAVAREVGYATPFALSTAFKRSYGVSPREHMRLTPA